MHLLCFFLLEVIEPRADRTNGTEGSLLWAGLGSLWACRVQDRLYGPVFWAGTWDSEQRKSDRRVRHPGRCAVPCRWAPCCPSAKLSPRAALFLLPSEALQLVVALAQAPRGPGSSGMGLGSSRCRNQSKTLSKALRGEKNRHGIVVIASMGRGLGFWTSLQQLFPPQHGFQQRCQLFAAFLNASGCPWPWRG